MRFKFRCFSDEGTWTDIFATLQTVDTMVVGRGMHTGYFGYWHDASTSPTATPNEQRYAANSARTPHFVVSRTLRSVEWANASVLGGVDQIAQLQEKSGGDIILYGGPTLAAAVIDAGLIDEYHFMVHPLIAGRGKKLLPADREVSVADCINVRTSLALCDNLNASSASRGNVAMLGAVSDSAG